MRTWLDAFEELRDQVGKLNLLRQKVSELERNRTTHPTAERAAGWAGKSRLHIGGIGICTSECEALASQLDEAKRKHDLLSKEVKDRNLTLNR